MKLFNIFKKETSKEVKSTIQKMDKNQLSTVIGGTDSNEYIDTTSNREARPAVGKPVLQGIQ